MEYSPYQASSREVEEVEGIRMIRWVNGPSLLASAQDIDPEFADTYMAKLVAWDHFSWPGNDFFANARQTDDGVSAAATNSMEVLLPKREGWTYHYDTQKKSFVAHKNHKEVLWRDVQPDCLLRPTQQYCVAM